MSALEKSSHLTQLTQTPHADSIRRLMSKDFKRITYTQALDILNESTKNEKVKSAKKLSPPSFWR